MFGYLYFSAFIFNFGFSVWGVASSIFYGSFDSG